MLQWLFNDKMSDQIKICNKKIDFMNKRALRNPNKHRTCPMLKY